MTDIPTAALRRALGPVGVFVGLTESAPRVEQQLSGVRRLEEAGHRAVWTNEVVGADALVRASLWLAATRRVVIGTCIANMWVRPAQTAHAAATQLHQAHPGRFVLGLGVGYPQQAAAVGRAFTPPVVTAGEYLRQASDPAYPRLLAANGPRMLALAGQLTDGALPAGAPPASTAVARDALGPDKLLVVYAPIGPSDAQQAVADLVDAHLAVGADHVIVGLPYTAEFETAIDTLEGLGSLAQDGA